MSTSIETAGSVQVPALHSRITVESWPSEQPLFAMAVFASAVIWLIAVVSIFGIFYGAILGIFFFVMHLAFIAHVRGSGVRLGPDQFPELHARIQDLGQRMGLTKVPDAYLMQAGGSLNAFATRFLGANIIVLFSDLLEACGDNTSARDMIIAHELGHIRAGHLRWHWFLLPASLVPFLGSALSRAREYTCDRYGLAGAGDRDGALLGLTILAAGGKHASQVNRRALVAQRTDLNTGWMTIGQWMSTHPPLAKRIAALDPALATHEDFTRRGILRALGILGLIFLPVMLAGLLAALAVPAWMERARQEAQANGTYTSPAPEDAAVLVQQRFAELSAFLDAEQRAGRGLPTNMDDLYERWQSAYPGRNLPIDPYDGQWLGYTFQGNGYLLWSSGPDQQPGSADDIIYTPASASVQGSVPE